MAAITLQRAYEPPAHDGSLRILVDRLWPRGVGKAALRLDFWMREVAPSAQLRRWFNHDPARFAEFRRRYLAELEKGSPELEQLRLMALQHPLTLVYGARDEVHNQAVVLREWLQVMIRGPDALTAHRPRGPVRV